MVTAVDHLLVKEEEALPWLNDVRDVLANFRNIARVDVLIALRVMFAPSMAKTGPTVLAAGSSALARRDRAVVAVNAVSKQRTVASAMADRGGPARNVVALGRYVPATAVIGNKRP